MEKLDGFLFQKNIGKLKSGMVVKWEVVMKKRCKERGGEWMKKRGKKSCINEKL